MPRHARAAKLDFDVNVLLDVWAIASRCLCPTAWFESELRRWYARLPDRGRA